MAQPRTRSRLQLVSFQGLRQALPSQHQHPDANQLHDQVAPSATATYTAGRTAAWCNPVPQQEPDAHARTRTHTHAHTQVRVTATLLNTQRSTATSATAFRDFSSLISLAERDAKPRLPRLHTRTRGHDAAGGEDDHEGVTHTTNAHHNTCSESTPRATNAHSSTHSECTPHATNAHNSWVRGTREATADFSLLPIEILERVLGYMDTWGKGACAQVCRSFAVAAQARHVWHNATVVIRNPVWVKTPRGLELASDQRSFGAAVFLEHGLKDYLAEMNVTQALLAGQYLVGLLSLSLMQYCTAARTHMTLIVDRNMCAAQARTSCTSPRTCTSCRARCRSCESSPSTAVS